MAIHASLGDGEIRIHGFEIVPSAYFCGANIRPDRVGFHSFQAGVLKLIGRTILRVDGPEADESKVNAQFAFFHQLGCGEQKLSGKRQGFIGPPVF